MNELSTAGTSGAAAPTGEDIVRGLERLILEHRLTPGAKLSEEEVGEIYGVGRTVVRGALRALAHRNLVTIHRNRGAFVAKPDPAEAREVFEARGLLEPRTARSAALRARPAGVALLRRHIADEHAALEAGEMGRAVYLSGMFHCAIADIAEQKTIAEFVKALVSRSSLVIALYWQRRDTLCESHAHHALIEAIAAGDGGLAQDLMQSHLVDLLSGLDLRDRPANPRSLREIMNGAS